MRRTYIYDPDLDAMVDVTRTNREPERRRSDGMQIISDIPAYRTAASDIATGGRVVIGGRRQHREFLARNDYYEVGNEKPPSRAPSWVEERAARDACVADIKMAMGKL